MPSKIATAKPHPAVTALLFVASVVLAGVISWFLYGSSDAGIELFCCPLFCTPPIVVVLTLILRSRKSSSLVTVLPLLVFPLLFILFFANIVYEKTPQYMFKRCVADPIPAGVTNIQGRYISQLVFVEAVITFQASPEAVDTIIAQNGFERDKVLDGYPDEDLPEYSWKGKWIGYEKRFYSEGGNLSGYVKMWYDQEQSLVVIRYVN
ncbi:MAG: hypothetical protein AB1894_15770 [Chloroflexota bacterium]